MAIADIHARDNSRKLAASFDLTRLPSDFYADPYPYYRALRDHEPVKRMPDGSWFLTRYGDIVPVYRDFKLFSSDKKKEFGAKYGATPLFEHHTTHMVATFVKSVMFHGLPNRSGDATRALQRR